MGKLRIVWILMLIIGIIARPSIQDDPAEAPAGDTGNQAAGTTPVKVGELSSCAHGLKGIVWAVHLKEVFIENFEYDGAGPGSWFTAMKKPVDGVYPVGQEQKTVLIPYGTGTNQCDRLHTIGKDAAFWKKNITLLLPDEITQYQTIGVSCHAACNNFGHVNIPEPLTGVPPVPSPAPADVAACPYDKTKFDQNFVAVKCDKATTGNAGLKQCDPPKTTPTGAGQFQPNLMMLAAGVVFLGWMARSPK